MDYFPILSFRPIETKESANDQDRTVLRICEGLVPYPEGALCAGPCWKSLWAMSTLGASIETALAGANTSKAHFVTVAKSGVIFLVVWSLQEHRALGGVCVVGATAPDLDSAGGVTITAPTGVVYRDKDPSALWFPSPVAGRIILGNGKDTNLVWHNGALRFFGPVSEPEDVNVRSRARIPPCTVFRQHVNLSLFAAGNATNCPLRVWITEAPNRSEGFMEGVYSLETSYIDVHPHGDAARITSLSVFQQYVTVHTDKKPVNLFGVDTRGNGWKCDQQASAANASAINPLCAGDAFGDAAFYLGSDLEVYLDQAIRSGPFEKKSARAQDIATEQGSGLWNKSAKNHPLHPYGYHTFYDRKTRLFWIWLPNKFDARPALFVYNERTRTVAGPWRYPAAVVSMPIPGPAGTKLAVITGAGEFFYADLAAIGEQQPEELEAAKAALGAGYAHQSGVYAGTAGIPRVVVDTTGAYPKFAEDLNGAPGVGLTDPFGEMGVLSVASIMSSLVLKDAYIARFEFPWQDMGGPTTFKNFLEVRLGIERNCRAYVGVFCETDAGRKGGKWKGLIYPKDTVRIPLNLFGLKIRVRVIAVVFNSGRFLVREAQIGYATGGKD